MLRGGRQPLRRVRPGLVGHTWPAAPTWCRRPARIAAGAEGRFWLQDLLGAAGSDGSATYRFADDPDREPIELWFTCPTVGTNECRGTTSFATRAGDREWRDDRIVHWGHPFFVES